MCSYLLRVQAAEPAAIFTFSAYDVTAAGTASAGAFAAAVAVFDRL